jgi:hypothetical protein
MLRSACFRAVRVFGYYYRHRSAVSFSSSTQTPSRAVLLEISAEVPELIESTAFYVDAVGLKHAGGCTPEDEVLLTAGSSAALHFSRNASLHEADADKSEALLTVGVSNLKTSLRQAKRHCGQLGT